MIAEQTRQVVTENGAMWRPKENGLKICSFLGQAKVQNTYITLKTKIQRVKGELITEQLRS